jgi:hypothetical protein
MCMKIKNAPRNRSTRGSSVFGTTDSPLVNKAFEFPLALDGFSKLALSSLPNLM